MKKKYLVPHTETVQSDYQNTFLEWISQGDKTPSGQPLDAELRPDDPELEELQKEKGYGTLW